MSFRHLDNIDEKIIDATIRVGSTNGANKLSTKEIAKACAISEFVIYDHFQSKENLVSVADKKVFDYFYAKAEEIMPGSEEGLYAFWNKMVDVMIEKADYNAFEINYGHLYPRALAAADYSAFMAEVYMAKIAESKFPIKTREDNNYLGTFIYLWIARSIISYAQWIISGAIIDNKVQRDASAKLACEGIGSFLTK